MPAFSIDVMPSVLGGALIGLAASLMMLSLGRILGVSGMLAVLFKGEIDQARWGFIAGILCTGLLFQLVKPELLVAPASRNQLEVALAGLLVGVGARLANGCTSGHGVCGLARLSPRSWVATGVFLGMGFVTASLVGLVERGL